jgi:hypothetical protein
MTFSGRLSSWRRFFIEGKLSLSFGGVILVLLSIVCSVGLYGYAGVSATLIIFEILPFLVSFVLQISNCKEKKFSNHHLRNFTVFGHFCFANLKS